MEENVKWTEKLPSLLLGIIFSFSGVVVFFWSKNKFLTLMGVILILVGASFITYSFTIKEWCFVNNQSAFSNGFSPSLRGCLRIKVWTEF